MSTLMQAVHGGVSEWVSGLMWVGLLIVFILGMVGASVLVALPKDVVIEPTDEEELTEVMLGLLELYQACGFRLAGPALKVKIRPPAIMIPLLDDRAMAYGTIFRTGTNPPRTAYDIVSVLEGGGGLTTTPTVDGATLPHDPRVFFQVFPRAKPDELLTQHRQAMSWLTSQGVKFRRLKEDDLPADLRDALNLQRAHFLRRPVRHVLIALWRSVSRLSPHRGPLEHQRIAQATLADMQQKGPAQRS